MGNMVETRDGEIVEILSGTLICENKAINWATIGDWMSAQPDGFSLMITTIGVDGRQLGIQTPDNVPTFNLNSLLEHFQYQ